MYQFSNGNKYRIRYWIKENIHLIWDAILRIQNIKNKDMVLRITFYEGSWPIVMQYGKSLSVELIESDCYVSEELWLIDSDFSSISAFADWVNNVNY